MSNRAMAGEPGLSKKKNKNKDNKKVIKTRSLIFHDKEFHSSRLF